MTLRNTTLTAVAALAVALAGGAVAQDSTTAADITAPLTSAQQDSSAAVEPQADEAAATSEPAAQEAAEAEAEPEAESAVDASDDAATDQDEASDAAPAPAEAEQDVTPADDNDAEAEVAAPETEAAEEAEPEAETAAPADDAAESASEEEAAPAEENATEAEAAAPEAEAAEEVEPEAEAPADEDSDEVAEPEAEDAAAPAEEAEEEDAAEAAVTAPHVEDIAFSFEGPFGKFDRFQLQRGLQVYTEVCAACHGLRYVPLRTLSDANGVGLPEDQVKAYAAELTPIMDPETEEERARLVTDHFPTVSGEGMGPDLSLMAKARAGFHGPYGTGVAQLFRGTGGPEYIHAILVGYNGDTKEEAGSTFYHNAAFDGNWIQMPEPLMDDMVTYEDGTPATVDQMARDVAAFLMWTAEPKMMDRKQVGLISVLFMIVLAALLYLTNKRLWWPIKHRDDRD